MLGFRPNLYWRICWKYLTPGFTGFLVFYYYYDLIFIGDERKNAFGDKKYPMSAHVFGAFLTFVGLVQLPAIAIYKVVNNEGRSLKEVSLKSFKSVGSNVEISSSQKIKGAFKPTSHWGPRDEKLHAEYLIYMRENNFKN